MGKKAEDRRGVPDLFGSVEKDSVPVDPQQVFFEYSSERKAQTLDGFRLDALPHLSRYTAVDQQMDGFVAFTNLPLGEEQYYIREQVAYFAGLGQSFEWKVYDFDQPSDLRSRLQEEGFTAEPTEAFMVFDLHHGHVVSPCTLPNVRVVRVNSEPAICHIVSVQQEVWGREFTWLKSELIRTLRDRPEEISIYCAYLDDHPIGTGWTRFLPQSQFADLHGGAVVREFRGSGVYSGLFQRRYEEARQRGYRYLAVDAAPMSRPILERKGFNFVCHTYPMRSAPRS